MERTFIKDSIKDTSKDVTICGWVNTRRDHGKIVFLDIRDLTGILQVIVLPGTRAYDKVFDIRPEWVVRIAGKVKKRPENLINKEIDSGKFEMEADDIEVLNKSKTPPFEISKNTKDIDEELRLKYRYLDLRSERMNKNITLRHKLIKFIREYLSDNKFREIETPYLTKSTPEGAREFIVPSRIYPGKFYSLPQAPQQFKQLLMVAGIERYFQIARCYRDEDQRGDRQPEFTQLDLEMSFVDREEVMKLNEDLLIKMIKEITPEKKVQDIPFPRLSFKESMDKYGTDNPDLRKDKKDPNLLAFCWIIDFPFFEKADNGNWTFTHNPFSKPKEESMNDLMSKRNIDSILTTQYDIILNGFEIAGGSIRNHQRTPLEKVFEIMAIDKEDINRQFGHMLEAFEYGAPPHGGIAWGFDRVAMILANEPNIREVITFPKTGDARDPMMDAPSDISKKQLDDVHICLKDDVKMEKS